MVVDRPKRVFLAASSSIFALLIYAGAFGDIVFKNSFEGTHRVVTSAADSGSGTLRQALLEAQDNDIITFDPAVFPPAAPVTISVASALPAILVNNLVLDASNAGVVLDGSLLPGDWEPGLQLISCEGSTVRGLSIANFSGRGIDISGDARYNIIGGDRSTGAGPFGQGNQLIHNGIGVILSTPGTTRNTIKGNLLGTDAAGTALLGNGREGIAVVEGAHGNTIGPDNVIAHNLSGGITLHGKNTINNSITRNSIHDNANMGINLWEGANDAALFPSVVAYDVAAGTITGAACSYCVVEVFSDTFNEGAVFEARIRADERGVFTFTKGSAFIGPHLTTTATHPSGNTSRFSAPLVHESWAAILQAGNGLHKTQFQSKRSNQIAGNGVGTGYSGMAWWSPDSYQHEVLVITELGLKQIDLLLQENEVPENGEIDWSKDEFEIPAEFDHFVDTLVANGISTKYVMVFWDKANHPDGWEGITSRFKTEEDIQRYLDFARFIVHHFKGRIQTYKLWNEPDCCYGAPEHLVEPFDMINLIERVIPVIQEEDPEAKVSLPSIVLMYAQDYLFSMLNTDLMPDVDVVTWETTPGVGPSEEEWSAFRAEYPALVQDIQETAVGRGFRGEYWAGSFEWWSPDHPPPPLSYPDGAVRAAKNVIRGVVLQQGLGVGTYLGGWPNEPVITWQAVKNLCTAMAGTTPYRQSAVIEGQVTNLKQYGFSHSNGDSMLAIWRDVEPSPDDAGVPVTITFPEMAGFSGTGIDLLYGFEQQLSTSDEDGSLVIHDLLVKDYPILLRLIAP
jgi:hypothetical protein